MAKEKENNVEIEEVEAVVENAEETKKEGLLTKGKNFINKHGNKLKVIGVVAGILGGVAVGAKLAGGGHDDDYYIDLDDDNDVDNDYVEEITE